jgi:transcriptional regulator with XRE-family HTH domain
MRQVGEILAVNLKQLRGDKGWKQQDLADKSGLGLETIKRLETNTIGFSKQTITQLAEALGVTEARLFLDPETRYKPAPPEALKVVEEALKLMNEKVRELEAGSGVKDVARLTKELEKANARIRDLEAQLKAASPFLSDAETTRKAIELWHFLPEVLRRYFVDIRPSGPQLRQFVELAEHHIAIEAAKRRKMRGSGSKVG